MKLPITLAVYTSTKGHFDRRDIYRLTIEHLEKKIPLSAFEDKVVHIKDSGEGNLMEIVTFFVGKGFRPIISSGDWKHFESSHQSEYLKDIFKVQETITTDYYFHLEDDWVFNIRQGTLLDFLAMGIVVLRNNNHILNVRFPAHGNEFERINGLKEKHGIDAQAVYDQQLPLIFHNDNWSLNPHLMRTRDLYYGVQMAKANFEEIKFHSEMGLAKVMRRLSGAPLHLSVIRPEVARVIHIGGPPFEVLIPHE